MIILIDTSTPTCRLTLVSQRSQITHEWEAGRTLAKGLLAFLKDKLRLSNVSIKDIEGIGVMRGPGSFTGLRIGMSVMNTLADSLDVPIIGSTGDSWQETVLAELKAGHDDKIVLPEYGSDAHITTPRK